MPDNFEDGGDSSFAGSIGEEDLQKINVASSKAEQSPQPFFNWLDNILPEEKGMGFYDWLNTK